MDQREVKDTKQLNSLNLQLKSVKNQVIVITSATSGIGLVKAPKAAKKGAKLVLDGSESEALLKHPKKAVEMKKH